MKKQPPMQQSDFWKSPALLKRSETYPERFSGRVPMRIKMIITVQPDPWCFALSNAPDAGTILNRDGIYEAWTNSHGAVCGICDNGFKLGVKPDEFEVVEWYEPTLSHN